MLAERTDCSAGDRKTRWITFASRREREPSVMPASIFDGMRRSFRDPPAAMSRLLRRRPVVRTPYAEADWNDSDVLIYPACRCRSALRLAAEGVLQSPRKIIR